LKGVKLYNKNSML